MFNLATISSALFGFQRSNKSSTHLAYRRAFFRGSAPEWLCTIAMTVSNIGLDAKLSKESSIAPFKSAMRWFAESISISPMEYKLTYQALIKAAIWDLLNGLIVSCLIFGMCQDSFA